MEMNNSEGGFNNESLLIPLILFRWIDSMQMEHYTWRAASQHQVRFETIQYTWCWERNAIVNKTCEICEEK